MGKFVVQGPGPLFYTAAMEDIYHKQESYDEWVSKLVSCTSWPCILLQCFPILYCFATFCLWVKAFGLFNFVWAPPLVSLKSFEAFCLCVKAVGLFNFVFGHHHW